ncbi:MAG: hypothetical protein AAF721_02870 [Myxococcota bacterium]
MLTLTVGCGRGPWFVAEQSEFGCRDGDIFASEVLSYEPDFAGAPPVHPDVLDPGNALGPPDWTNADGDPGTGAVALGQGGRLELGFGGCSLGNDGSRLADVRIYEIGPAVERFTVFVRATADSVAAFDPARRVDPGGRYFSAGELGGGVSELDLDQIVVPGRAAEVDAILFEDDPLQGSGSNAAWGADIDAVELLLAEDFER